jgi:hypothetical protein
MCNRTLGDALVKFDAIFTLNQDLLFERYYLNEQAFNVSLETNQRLLGCILPGMKETRDASAPFPYDIGPVNMDPVAIDRVQRPGPISALFQAARLLPMGRRNRQKPDGNRRQQEPHHSIAPSAEMVFSPSSGAISPWARRG